MSERSDEWFSGKKLLKEIEPYIKAGGDCRVFVRGLPEPINVAEFEDRGFVIVLRGRDDAKSYLVATSAIFAVEL